MLKKDPGDCPVDDAAHTSCTSADYDPSRFIVAGPINPATTVIVSAPRLPQVQLQAAPPKGTTFTTTSRGLPRRKTIPRTSEDER
jgi:hypothetical protein